MLLRPGAVSLAQLNEIVPVREKIGASVRHSGGLERHYAPRTPARLIPAYALDKEISLRKSHLAVLAFSRPDERVEYWIRMSRDPILYARELYAKLRELDGAGCAQILVEAPPETDEWRAVRDRLVRACASGAVE